MEIKLKLQTFKALNKILLKPVQKLFFRLYFISKYFKKPIRIKLPEKKNLTINTDPNLLKALKNSEKHASRSPIETSERLYCHAKELKKKKEILKESYREEYSFTPKVTGFTGKWLQIKQNEKKNAEKAENIAVVSAQNIKAITINNTLRSFTPIL